MDINKELIYLHNNLQKYIPCENLAIYYENGEIKIYYKEQIIILITKEYFYINEITMLKEGINAHQIILISDYITEYEFNFEQLHYFVLKMPNNDLQQLVLYKALRDIKSRKIKKNDFTWGKKVFYTEKPENQYYQCIFTDSDIEQFPRELRHLLNTKFTKISYNSMQDMINHIKGVSE